MSHAIDTLDRLGVAHDTRIMSAHRTPHEVSEWASSAEERGLQVIIAAAGGAAHLGGVVAAHTVLPVLGVPMQTSSLGGLDSLLSIVQMPGGVPVGTFSIGKAGAVNAALFACAILGVENPAFRDAYREYREDRARKVLADSDPTKPPA
jgi:5-(carboxyamino)imidazole ribonucleotide mutase